MNVTLAPEFEAMIRERVERGTYNDATEVVQEALRLLDERDRLLASLDEAAAEFERGEGVEWTPELMEQIREEADRAVGEIGTIVASDQSDVRRLTPEEQRRALAALERAERTQAKILADRGGEPFSPSWELLNEARDERTRQLS